MPSPTKAERLAKIHAQALEQFDAIQEAVREERLLCLEDRRFYSIAGAQWEGDLAEQFENKPKFEVNKIHVAVMRIINEYRNNRISVEFVAKDGTDSSGLSDVCNGLYRADEQDSCADEAYDNAFEEAVGGGFGAFRLTTTYDDPEDEETDYQRVRIEPIFDADSSVFFDLGAKRQDKSDAKYCFVITSVTREDYEEEWGDDPATWPKEIIQSQYDWALPDIVHVAEYYVVEEKKELVQTWANLIGEEEKYDQSDFDADPELEKTLLSTGNKKLREKKIERRHVHKYILSGGDVLEDCGIIAGKFIPVIPTFGKRWFIDNIERCMGHVRLAKDAQRLKNMQLSKLGELSALSSIEKPILTPDQIVGHTQMWSEDNLKNYPYLLINATTDAAGNPMPAAPVAYTRPPQVPPAMAALLSLTDGDIQSILGNQQEADKMVSNISGKAVEMIQNRMDMQTFIYVSNFAKAIRRAGEVWLSIAKEIYTSSGRKMKTLDEQGGPGSVELLTPTIDKETGATGAANDLTRAAFDVSVTVGPSSQSRKSALVRELTGMLAVTQDQDTAQIIQLYALMNMEGEGLGDLRKYIRTRLVSKGVIVATEEDKKIMAEMAASAPTDPNADAMKAMADQAAAEATKARAAVIKTVAETQKINAETQQIITDTDQAGDNHVLGILEKTGELPAPGAAPIQSFPQAQQAIAGSPEPAKEKAPVDIVTLHRLANAEHTALPQDRIAQGLGQ